MKLNIPFIQAHISPIVACLIEYFIMSMVRLAIFIPIWNAFGIISGIIVILVILIITLMVVFFPLTGFLGAWDDASLRDFKKAARMSGPSKIIVWPMYKGAEFGSRYSKLHNRFGMDATLAIKEARELLEIKHSHWKNLPPEKRL